MDESFFLNFALFCGAILSPIAIIGSYVKWIFTDQKLPQKLRIMGLTATILVALVSGLLLAARTSPGQHLTEQALCPTPVLSTEYPVYVGTGLAPEFDFGADTSGHQHSWFTDTHGSVVINYPSQQQWGTVFVTRGTSSATGAARSAIDLSSFRCLSVEMRGQAGGETVGLSIKDLAAASNGPSLVTVKEQLTGDWQTIRLPLDTFAHTDLTHVFVVFEVDFAGTSGEQVAFRNLRYES